MSNDEKALITDITRGDGDAVKSEEEEESGGAGGAKTIAECGLGKPVHKEKKTGRRGWLATA